MPIRALLPALALLAGLLCAQAPETEPGSVEGIVVNAVTTEPIRKAAVTLQGISGPSAASAARISMTDAAGHFRFDNVAPGSYWVAADRDGFLASYRRGTRMTVTVAEGQQVQDVAVKLLPLATVKGHVLDEDGDPLVRANVRAMQYQYNQGRKQLVAVGFAGADDRGEFEIASLEPGRYYLMATAGGADRNVPPRTRWTHPDETYPTTFYPNATDVGQAMATDLAAGAKLNGVDFRLQKVPAYHLRGKMTGMTNGMLGFVQLRSASANGADIVPMALQKDGSFDQGGIVSGWYDLAFSRQDSGTVLYGHEKVNVTDQDINDLILNPSPGLDISGAVSVEGTAPDRLMVQVSLDPVEPSMFFRGPTSHMGDKGSFTIQGLSREAYRVGVFNTPPGKYVKSIRFGARDIKDGQIDLTSGVAAPLSIVLGADGASISGTVEMPDGTPAVGAWVTVVPEGDSRSREDLFKLTASDARGKYEIRGIAPGEYRLFAWEVDTDGLTRSAEFRAAFESKSVAVALDANGHASTTLTAITFDEIEKQRSKMQ
ncbi:MAG TPA: carboxypeptidase-like regulatory domain-containing protein [Bryobacteraceae bacterium]|nr:carboxypeptidase-like regulatory domain-containing protein [Bryobacteraceae bacterium]